MRFQIALSRHVVAIGVVLGACACTPAGHAPLGASAAATSALAKNSATPSVLAATAAATGVRTETTSSSPQAPASTVWTVRVLPSTSAQSEPTFLLDEGIVVGTDTTIKRYEERRPWIWSPATGRQDLDLGGADWATVGAAAGPLGMVGTTYREDPQFGSRGTAVRWVNGQPVPLLTGTTQNAVVLTGDRAGDAVVAIGRPDAPRMSLVDRGQAPVPLPLFGRQSGQSMNTAHQILISSVGMGTNASATFGVLTGTDLVWLVSGNIYAPACIGDITESGYVAASAARGPGTTRQQAILWRDGVRTVLPDEGRSASIPCSRHPVNEAGQVVGTLSVDPPRLGRPAPHGPPAQTVVWRDGRFVVLATDTAAERVDPVAINDRGAVLAVVKQVGRAARPAVYAHGKRQLLPVPAGVSHVSLLDLNQRNQVVGSGTRTVGGKPRTVVLFWMPPTS